MEGSIGSISIAYYSREVAVLWAISRLVPRLYFSLVGWHMFSLSEYKNTITYSSALNEMNKREKESLI